MSVIKEIDAATLKDWMDRGEAVIVDVRGESEYKQAHIPGAVLRPLGTFMLSDIDHAGKKIVFQCRAGQRSMMACQQIAASVPAGEEIYSLRGGIDSWADQNYAIERK